jgi:hypothetical protein
MSPRTLTAAGKHGFRHLEKMRARGQEQADRDGAPMAVVVYDGLVFIRPLARALRLVDKHGDAEIIAELRPDRGAA